MQKKGLRKVKGAPEKEELCANRE